MQVPERHKSKGLTKLCAAIAIANLLLVKVSVKGGLVDGLDWSQGEHIFTETAVFPIPSGATRWEAMPDSFGKEGDRNSK